MRERGMIFNAEMVRAILNGSKTQTRRTMKTQPEPSKTREGDHWFSCSKLRAMVHVSDFTPGNSKIPDYHEFLSKCCPFGEIGDRIWVRETWARYNIDQNSHDMAYRATKPEDWPQNGRWRPSIHMPRWASRISLEITAVRVERLNVISAEDAKAEGVTPAGNLLPDHPGTYLTPNGDFATAEVAFQRLWESIYSEPSWQDNSWVWVIEFKRVEASNV